jgi:putative ABC transport system permease protein
MGEIRNAVRALRATPIVSAVAVLSLALGIGANTAMFSILDSLLLRALPVREPHQLVTIGDVRSGRSSWTNPIWEAIRERSQLGAGALAYSHQRFNLSLGGQTEFADGLWTSGRYFDVLGVSAVLGRTWVPADDRRGGGPDGPVAVLGYDFWQRRFGGDATVIGRPLAIERVTYTIVGITPPGFTGLETGRSFDVAVPIGTEPIVRGSDSSLDQRSYWWLTVTLRLRPGQTLVEAETTLRGIQPQIRDETLPQDLREEDKKSYLTSAFALLPGGNGESSIRSRYQRPLLTMMAVVGVVLLIACANIANLLLARATARRHELSVRVALGASRLRLARQLLTESLLLSGLGAAIGLLFAQWFSRLLVRQLSTSTNTVYLDLTLDWRVLGFTALVAITTAVLFGTIPALRAARVDPHDAIKAHGRGPGGDTRFRLGNVLVVVQVALSLMLVVAAGLFVRTFATLATRHFGFDRDPVLIASIDIQPLKLAPEARWALWTQLRDAAAAMPGVSTATLSATTPIGGGTWIYTLEQLDGARIAATDRGTYANMVSPGWFTTYGTRLIAGRDFTDHDVQGAPFVAIVNETFARKFLGGANPIGHRVRRPSRPAAPSPEYEIVGLVADAAYRSLREPIPATMYLSFAQNQVAPSLASIGVRAASGSPMPLTRGLAAALTNVHPGIAITFRPLSEQVGAALTQERVVATLSGFFGGMALLLAGLGLYGVTSYAVSRRRTEIGIRMALGAAPGGVVAMVLSRVMVLVLVGIAAGAALSLWASTYVTTLLYELQPRDPATLIGSAVVLAMIGVLAGGLPALRAAKIDPARVLRNG